MGAFVFIFYIAFKSCLKYANFIKFQTPLLITQHVSKDITPFNNTEVIIYCIIAVLVT